MPAINESSLKQRLDLILQDEESDTQHFRARLHEKGVEFCVLMPIIEILLGFDALNDVTYETSSEVRNDERFDFLVDGCFMVEAKSLDKDLDNSKIKSQIVNYILHNDNINYGFLSNGFQFVFYMQKSYIKSFLTGGQELKVPIKKDVLPFLTLSIGDEHFIDIMKLFSKDTYREHFNRIAKFILSKYNQGRKSKIADDKKINEILKEMITNTIDVTRGFYLSDLKAGKINAGDTLRYEDDNICIEVIVEDNGCVRLTPNKAVIKNMNDVMDTPFKPMIELVLKDWKDKEIVFESPYDIIRQAKGAKRLSDKESYEFCKTGNKRDLGQELDKD